MAKTATVKKELPKGLEVKVKVDNDAKGRFTVTVSLFQDGVLVSSDFDWTHV